MSGYLKAIDEAMGMNVEDRRTQIISKPILQLINKRKDTNKVNLKIFHCQERPFKLVKPLMNLVHTTAEM